MELTICPQCGEPAEIEWRSEVESTDGPVGVVYVRCLQRHWFLLPEYLVSAAVSPSAASETPGGKKRRARL